MLINGYDGISQLKFSVLNSLGGPIKTGKKYVVIPFQWYNIGMFIFIEVDIL